MWTPGSNKEDWLCCLLSSIHADCSLTQKAWASRALWVFRIGDATLFLTYEIPYIWCQIFLIGTGWSSCSSVTPPAAYKPTTHGSDDCQACWKVITRWMQRACHDTHSVWTSRQANEDSASPPKENAISERGAALDSAWRGNYSLYLGERQAVPPSYSGPRYAVLSQVPCGICTFPHHPRWGRTFDIKTNIIIC